MMTREQNITEWVNGAVERQSEEYIHLNDEIWDLAETRFAEYASVEAQIKLLERAGFRIHREVGGLPTAFMAEAGAGGPISAFLGEYDALSEMSQIPGEITEKPLKQGCAGHGCGHHALGAGAMLAAVVTRDYLAEKGMRGTVRYYGCPAEEGGAGKTYMVREGVFDGVDFALTWHPGPFNGIFKYKSLAVIQAYFRFKGRAAHAAAAPQLGRSALDAVELMNVGVNFLREHMPSDARVHYAITNTGGLAPNVVQPLADVLYVVRAPDILQAAPLFERVKDIARGAALMTETELTIEVDRACSDVVRNSVIEASIFDNLQRLGPPPFDEADQAHAARFTKTFDASDIAECIDAFRGTKDGLPLDQAILPLEDEPGSLTGSSDVGDVSWVVPTTQYLGACYAVGTNFHTWQLVAQGMLPAAHKGMLHAAKVLAAAGIELTGNPEKVALAKAELKKRTAGKPYVCPIPADVLPPPLRKNAAV